MPLTCSNSSGSSTRRRLCPRTAPQAPLRLCAFGEERGLKIIIAGAGGAAHLPGMTASMTALPVLGVPVESKALKGMDSLLSIVQMPAGRAGRHPCDRQGRRDQRGLLAAAMLATNDDALAARLEAWRDRKRDRSPKRPNDGSSRLARLGSSAAASSAACSASPRRSSATSATSSTRMSAPARPMSAAQFTRASFDDAEALERFGIARSTSPPTNSRTYRSARSRVLGEKLRPGARSLAVAQDRAVEKQFIEDCGGRVASMARRCLA